METELRILLHAGFISRRQFRDLSSRIPATLEDLRRELLERGIIDSPDWTEALRVVSAPQLAEKEPPLSRNSAMHALIETARRVSQTDTTVLILGESGVGKSRLARFIHTNSPRRQGPFITVSCGSIPENLLESELFGVEKGAYTGAVKTREGRFQAAHGGTIFLDEVGELPPPLQVKLLRVIQERKIEPLGSGKETEVDVRVIAATNRDLDQDVASGRFREDLYFRLNVVPLVMLPLRDRREDIIPLANYFLSLYGEKDGTRYGISRPEILSALDGYSWPGNIRELENCMERMAVLSKNGDLKVTDLPPRILEEANVKTGPHKRSAASVPASAGLPEEDHPPDVDQFPSMRDIEDRYIRLALQTSRGSIIKAADLLKIHRNTLSRKIEEMGIDPTAYKERKRSRRTDRESINESRQTADV